MAVREWKRHALVAGMRAAVEATETLVDESTILVETSASMRASALVTRCAWCDRYLLAGRWRLSSEVPGLVETVGRDRLTHSICDSCVRHLRTSGASH
jgi:hypothetical protein